MTVTGRESLLMMMLDCGSDDLRLLDDVGYDWPDIFAGIDEVADVDGLNGIMREVFRFGYSQIAEAVSDRICELEAITNERELDEDEENELAALRELRPTDGDFSSYHNFIDTSVWCEKHGETYKAYLQDALDSFEEGTGFYITI